MVQYYTLEQAAQILRTTPEKLKEMAKKNEVRAFQDPKGLRFRAQEIDELARSLGIGSDHDLPTSPPKTPGRVPAQDAGVFDFDLGGEDSDDEVPIGQEPPTPDKSTSRSSPGTRSPSPGPKSSVSKTGGSKSALGKGSSKSQLGKSPPPKPASDSDVRLVMEGSDLDFQIEVDSDVKVGKDPASNPSPGPSRKSKMGSPSSRVLPQDKPSDSDVRMVPPSDEVALGKQGARSPSDSDIRIEQQDTPAKTGLHGGPVRRSEIVTEEIDLDAEASKAEAARPAAPSRPRPATPELPTSSPFELSEHDIGVDAPKTPAPAAADDSSDFELSVDVGSSPIELGSDEVPVLMNPDDEVTLGELSGAGGASGINLQDPVDSGISLEAGGSDEIEFELSLEGGATPKPAKAGSDEDESSSSEFELSLDEAAPPTSGEEESSSEFELNLDVESSGELSIESPKADSDSEFELTLDETGGLSLEEEAAPQEEQDIFETDFDVPAMDEESGSEAVALDEADTDLESSEFDLSLEEQGEESGSQVVPLEESLEDSEEVAEEEGFGEELDEDLDREPEAEAEEEEEEEAPAATAAAAPAPWGVLPALVLMPAVIVLFVVGLMSFELLQGMWGYHKPSKVSNLIIHPLAKAISGDDKLPED